MAEKMTHSHPGGNNLASGGEEKSVGGGYDLTKGTCRNLGRGERGVSWSSQGGLLEALLFPPLKKITALLKYNLYTVQFPHLQHTIQWFLL